MDHDPWTGSQNGGGHSYAGATGPALLLDKDRTIKPADVFSLSFTPINSRKLRFLLFICKGE